MFSSLLKRFHIFIDAVPPKKFKNKKLYTKIILDIHSLCIPFFRRMLGHKSADYFIRLDEYLSRVTSYFEAMSFLIVKDSKVQIKPKREIPPSWLMNSALPFYYLKDTQIKLKRILE